ncbi:hypothetical protein SKAU_G00053250 [Synaphobranchus kaupii]|uniref:Uncharacterized protein n=1 Tax=Synaphobranchus kaupii TaxID=118154 RepID=A0A9Q1J9Z6_SYNKA|nr:hypothetical protein SKAU_G00053250 [Synaphobranchus kaupii]
MINNISATSKLPIETSTTGTFSTLDKTSTSLHPISFSTVTPFSNDSGLTSAHVSTNASIGGQHGTITDLASNPGLVAVLCIFFIVLALLVAVAIAKSLSSRRPQFEKLDDVQMDKMNEESPFASYPPKIITDP